MPRRPTRRITDSILSKVHAANNGYGTSLSVLSKTYGVPKKNLSKELREWRKRNGIQVTSVSNKQLDEAADKVAPNQVSFRSFDF